MERTITAASFLALGVAYLLFGLRYPMLNAEGAVAAGFFPRIIAAAWVAIGVYTLFSEIRSRKAPADGGDTRDALVLGGLTIAFVIGLGVFGSMISIAAFTAAVLFLFNRGHALVNGAVTLALPLAVHVVFVQLFATELPQGLLRIPGLP